MGEPDLVNLRAELERAGWTVESLGSDSWWEYDCWALTSTWRPTGARAFLSFVVNPEAETPAIRSVWSIAVSAERPLEYRAENQATISVSPHWPTRLKEVVAAVALLRPAK